MKKICFLCSMHFIISWCKVSHQSSENKNRKKEKTTIDSLAPNPFIRHMYTADPSAVYGMTAVCMSMHRMT